MLKYRINASNILVNNELGPLGLSTSLQVAATPFYKSQISFGTILAYILRLVREAPIISIYAVLASLKNK